MKELNFKICNRCKTVDYKFLIGKLRELFPTATFNLKCQSFCGPGSNEPFLAVNEVYIQAKNVEELLEKTLDYLRCNYAE